MKQHGSAAPTREEREMGARGRRAGTGPALPVVGGSRWGQREGGRGDQSNAAPAQEKPIGGEFEVGPEAGRRWGDQTGTAPAQEKPVSGGSEARLKGGIQRRSRSGAALA